MQTPVVSVVTPSLNHAAYLRDCIESVLAQGDVPAEHIVVDGGSTDGTLHILREYGDKYPARFRWISEPDAGQSDAINKGLRLARGNVIGWQNADDYYCPDVFQRLVSHLAGHPEVSVAYGDCLRVDAAGLPIGKWGGPFDYRRLVNYHYVPNQAALIRRESLLACGGVAIDLEYAMDYHLFLRLGVAGDLAYLPGVIAVARFMPDAKSNAGLYSLLIERVECLERVLRDPRFPPESREAAREALVRHVLKAAATACLLGRWQDAGALLRRPRRSGIFAPGWMRSIIALTREGGPNADHSVSTPALGRALALLRDGDGRRDRAPGTDGSAGANRGFRGIGDVYRLAVCTTLRVLFELQRSLKRSGHA